MHSLKKMMFIFYCIHAVLFFENQHLPSRLFTVCTTIKHTFLLLFLSAFNHPLKNNVTVASFPALARKIGPSGPVYMQSTFLQWRKGSHCHKVIKTIRTWEPDTQNRIIQLISSVWFKLGPTNKFSKEWKSEGMRNRVYGKLGQLPDSSNTSC